MTDEVRNLSSKLGLDTTDFKTAIVAANRELRVLESGFKAGAATMVDWSKDASGLEMRIKSLTGQIDIQKLKVAALGAEHKRLVEANGANSRAAQKAEIDLNKETAALNKMELELKQDGKALTDLKNDSDKAATGVKNVGTAADNSAKKANNLKNVMGGLTAGLKATIAVAVAAAAAIGLIAGALVGMAAATIKPASDLQETISKVGIVFGDNAPAVKAFGENAATSLGMSQNAALSAAATYGNLFRAIGLTTDKSADMSIELVKLAGDLASFNNIPIADALQKLQSGLAGEAEPLKSLGILMNQATLEAQAMQMGLVPVTVNLLDVADAQNNLAKATANSAKMTAWYGADSQKAVDAALAQAKAEEKLNELMAGKVGEMTPAIKAQAAYGLMMAQSALASGDFERTSGGLANQQKILAAQFEDVKAVIGTAFLPIVVTVVQALNDFLSSGAMSKMLTELTTGITAAGEVLKPFIDLIANSGGDMSKVTAGAIGIIQTLVSGLAAQAPQLVQGAMGIIKTLMDALLPALPSLMESGALMLVSVLQGLISAAPTLVKAGLVMIITLTKGLADALPGLLKTIAEVMPEIGKILIENLPLLLTVLGQLVLALIQGVILSYQITWPLLWQLITTNLAALWQWLSGWFTSLSAQVMTWLNGMFGESVGAFGVWLAGIGQALQSGFDGLVSIIQTVGLVLLGLVLILLDGILSLFGTNLADLSAAVSQGWNQIVDTVSKKAAEILSTVTTWGGKVITETSTAWNGVVKSVSTAFGKVLTALGEMLTPVTDAMNDIWTAAVETASGFIDQFFEIGANIIAGIGEGIQSGVDALGQIIQDVIDAAIAKAKAALGIASPSKLFAAEVGIQIPAGIGVGIENAMPALNRTLSIALGGLTLNPALAGGRGGSTNNSTDNSNTYYGAVYNVYRSGESGPAKSKRF